MQLKQVVCEFFWLVDGIANKVEPSTIPRDESVLGFDLRSNSATMNSGKKALLLPSVSAESELSGAMSLLIVEYQLFTSGEKVRLA